MGSGPPGCLLKDPLPGVSRLRLAPSCWTRPVPLARRRVRAWRSRTSRRRAWQPGMRLRMVGHESAGHRSDDAHRYVGLVALLGQDLDAEEPHRPAWRRARVRPAATRAPGRARLRSEPAFRPCRAPRPPAQFVFRGRSRSLYASCWSAAAYARVVRPAPPCRGLPARRRSHRASRPHAARPPPATASGVVGTQTAPRHRWTFTLNSTWSSIAAIRSCGVWSSANRSPPWRAVDGRSRPAACRCAGRRARDPRAGSAAWACPLSHRQSPSSAPPTASSSPRVISASIAIRDARLPSSSLSSSRIPACISSRRAFR